MNYKKHVLALLSSLLISACSSTQKPPMPEPLILPWPTPIMKCVIGSVKVTENGEVILSYQDNINIAVCDQDMFRYIKDLTNMVCIHQPKDKRCKQETK